MAKKSILSKQKIRFGHDAVKPAQDPTLEGCDFLGWDKEYRNVHEDMEIVALFKRREYTVKFLNQDGGVIQSMTVKHGQDAVPPTPPEVQGKTFIGWDT